MKRGHTTSQITNADLDTHSDSPFVTSRQVVAQPGDVAWLTLIQRASSNENTCIRDAGMASRYAHNEADSLEAQADKDPWRAKSLTISRVCYSNRNSRSNDVYWDSQQLCCRRLVPKLFDDRRQEQRDTVQWTDITPIYDDVDPDLPVTESSEQELLVRAICLSDAISVFGIGILSIIL